MPRLLHYQPSQTTQASVPAVSMPPPQIEGQGSRLASLALGAGSKIVELIARDHARFEAGRVDEAILGVEREFEQWKTGYMQTNQGRDATLAQRDFTLKYEELAKRALEGFGGGAGEMFRGDLEKKLAARGLMYMKEGGAYQRHETEVWEKSLLDGKIAELQTAIKTDPANDDRHKFLMGEVLENWRRLHPGEDETAFRARLLGDSADMQAQALMADGNFEAVQAMLGQRGSQALPAGGKVPTGGMPEDVRQTIVKTAQKYGVEPELALAVAMQESGGNQKSVSRAGAIGVMQLMPGTAKDLGVNPDDMTQNIDGGVRYLSKMLKQFGNREDALTAYNWGPGAMQKHVAGGRKSAMPKEAREYAGMVMKRMGASTSQSSALSGNPWLSPQRRIQLHDQLDARRAEQERLAIRESEKALFANITSLASEAAMLPKEKRQDYVMTSIAGIQDPEMRATAQKWANQELKFVNDAIQARYTSIGYDFAEKGKAYTPSQFRRLLADAPIPNEAREIAEKIFMGEVRETELNRDACKTLMADIDAGYRAGAPISENDIYRRADDSRMTPEQLKQMLKYRENHGALGDLEFSKIRSRWQELMEYQGEKGRKEDFPAEIYDAVRMTWEPGQPVTDRDIDAKIASLIVKGRIGGEWFGSTTRAKAIVEGKSDRFKSNDDLELIWRAEDSRDED